MISVVLLGTGNVATHLFKAFTEAKMANVLQVYGRNKNALLPFSYLTKTTVKPEAIVEADVYIIAVSDQAIIKLSKQLEYKKGLVAHTSGSVPLNALTSKRKGVFYPLQTFSKEKKVDFSEIPLCIEAEHKEDLNLLKHLGKSIGDKVHEISSLQREKLHLSAVIVNNFTNHLFYWASELCENNDLSFKLLEPLISETVEKIKYLSPLEAQTGPAKRNDIETMQRHLSELQHPLKKKIYQLLSESIKTTYEKEL